MRLTWRDLVATGLVAVAGGVTLSVVYGWNWPLIGDARAAGVALFALSFPSCLIGRAQERMQQAIEHRAGWGAYLVGAIVLGSVIALLILATIIFNSTAVLVAATGVMVLLWLVTTVDHLIDEAARPIAIRS